jgi:Zn-dependent peptidase ImmA (M78 family)
MIVGSNRRAIITVNNKAIPVRRRFSIAHEIGHWHHHRGRILFCGGRDIGNLADEAFHPEKQADQFASDLILPNFMVRPRVFGMKRPTLAAVWEIADEFEGIHGTDLFEIMRTIRSMAAKARR